jgi:hypothetical protein
MTVPLPPSRSRPPNCHQDRETVVAVFPPEGYVERIQRYETHIHRLFLKGLHELEVLQAAARVSRSPSPASTSLILARCGTAKPKIAKRTPLAESVSE